MLHMKKIYFNQGKSEQDCESAILLYFKGLLAMERLTGEEVDIELLINQNWEISRPTIKRIASDAMKELSI